MAKASRDLNDLHPIVKVLAIEFIAKAEMRCDCKILVLCTLRDEEEQLRLFQVGRTVPGKILTNAGPGDSYHNWGLAFDAVPVRNGKALWDDKDPIWQELGAIAKEVGLEWAGDWKTFKEYDHFQYTQGLTIAQLKAGAELNHAIV